MTKILVIEDEDPIRDEVMDWLTFEGFEVIGADNGCTGVEAVEHEHPDLILCDIAMPEMDGHAVLIEVRSQPDSLQTPFIFLTAAADRESVRKGMNLGADDYITKPFTHAEVMNTVHSRLGKKIAQEQQIHDRLEALHTAMHQEREQHLLRSRLVAMFSHDFRNPLASILSSSGIIRNYEDRLTPERKQQHLDRIDGSVRMLIQMLDDMLIVAELETGHLHYVPQPIALAEFIAALVEEFRLIDQDGHSIVFRAALHPTIQGDPKLLRQAISNLLSNALKYSPDESEVLVSLSQQGDALELDVYDHGRGIPPDDLPQLFQPFYRASNVGGVNGTGLGLAIVQQAVELHGGSIAVESTLDQGTCFRIRLPITAA